MKEDVTWATYQATCIFKGIYLIHVCLQHYLKMILIKIFIFYFSIERFSDQFFVGQNYPLPPVPRPPPTIP